MEHIADRELEQYQVVLSRVRMTSKLTRGMLVDFRLEIAPDYSTSSAGIILEALLKEHPIHFRSLEEIRVKLSPLPSIPFPGFFRLDPNSFIHMSRLYLCCLFEVDETAPITIPIHFPFSRFVSSSVSLHSRG